MAPSMLSCKNEKPLAGLAHLSGADRHKADQTTPLV